MTIVFATVAENMVTQLPQVDPGVIVGAVALVVAVITFYISHTQTSRLEQLKTSMYMWERINVKYDKIREIAKTKGWEGYDKSGHIDVPTDMVWSLVREIDYFANLILSDAIKDEVVLRYYKEYLSQYIESILKYYTPLTDGTKCTKSTDTLISLLRNGRLIDRKKSDDLYRVRAFQTADRD